eukprot:2592165-Pyramimonas_sp.AAC.1
MLAEDQRSAGMLLAGELEATRADHAVEFARVAADTDAMRTRHTLRAANHDNLTREREALQKHVDSVKAELNDTLGRFAQTQAEYEKSEMSLRAARAQRADYLKRLEEAESTTEATQRALNASKAEAAELRRMHATLSEQGQADLEHAQAELAWTTKKVTELSEQVMKHRPVQDELFRVKKHLEASVELQETMKAQ